MAKRPSLEYYICSLEYLRVFFEFETPKGANQARLMLIVLSAVSLLTLVRLHTRVREHVRCESILVSTFLSTHPPVTHEALFYTDGCGWFDTLFGRG